MGSETLQLLGACSNASRRHTNLLPAGVQASIQSRSDGRHDSPNCAGLHGAPSARSGGFHESGSPFFSDSPSFSLSASRRLCLGAPCQGSSWQADLLRRDSFRLEPKVGGTTTPEGTPSFGKNWRNLWWVPGIPYAASTCESELAVVNLVDASDPLQLLPRWS